MIVDSIVDRTLRLGGFVDLQICESMKLDLNNMWQEDYFWVHSVVILGFNHTSKDPILQGSFQIGTKAHFRISSLIDIRESFHKKIRCI